MTITKAEIEALPFEEQWQMWRELSDIISPPNPEDAPEALVARIREIRSGEAVLLSEDEFWRQLKDRRDGV